MTHWLDEVRAATIGANIVLSGTTSLDGVLIVIGDAILVKDQTAASQNGTYVGAAGAWSRRDTILPPEATVRVSEGTLNRNTEWVLTTIASITVGTTALVFSKAWASTEDATYYVSTSPYASDTFDGLSPGTAFATIQRALIAIGYTTGAFFSYAVAVTNGSSGIAFSAPQTIPAGTPITFASQSGIFYYLATNVNASMSGALTTAYSGTTNAATTANPGVGKPGSIQLLGGTFATPAGGLALGPVQSIEGCGATASKILGTTATSGDGNAVLTLNGSRSSARNLWIQNKASGTAFSGPVGLRIGIAGTGTNENSIVENIYCENQPASSGSAIAVAFGVGDITTGDVSDCVMINCTSVTANTTAGIGMKIGASTGNVLDMTVIGGSHYGNQYGIMIDGGAAVFTGVNFSYNGSLGLAGADIYLLQTPVGSVSFNGGRSENSLRFITSTFGNFALSTNVSNYTVVGLRNTDGQGIQLSSGLVALHNVAMLGLTCPQYIFQPSRVPDLDYPYTLDVENFASQHPFPLGSPWVRGNQINTTRGFRFCGDSANEIWARCTTSDRRVKRHNVIDATGWTLDPIFCDAYEVRLSASAGTFALLPGALGKLITICVEQDGKGSWTWTWPANIAWSGGSAPANVTTSRNRQSCTFQWSGRYWVQCGSITNIVPPSAIANPITDNFSGSVGRSANPYWLNYPDTVGTTTRWEHAPGGGSLGISGGKCVTNCLGLSGDNDLDLAAGNFGLAAIKAAWAVIETGMGTQPTGISATFTWQLSEGIVAHYLDDQTFMLVYITSTTINLRGYTHGVPMVGAGNLTHGVTMVAGSIHTLVVKCTATGFTFNLDSGAFTATVTLGATDLANFNDLTKHGIFSASLAATFTQFKVS